MTRPASTPRVVILGGGFAGLSAARELRADRQRVTLVSARRSFEFLPNIHELISGVKTPDLLRLPLDRAMKRLGHTFVHDHVTAIDPETRHIELRSRRGGLHYDVLIVALGGVDSTRGVSGIAEHGYPFKSVDECARIGTRLEELAARNTATRVVIVGGGLEGVEALGEVLRRYRRERFDVTLVDAGDRLLAEAPASLDRHVRELCESQPVTFETNASVERIEAERVVLADGRDLPSDVSVWTGGPAPPALLADAGLASEGKWAPVDDTLRSRTHPEVFIAGDAADLPADVPKQGYHALDMGACVARNVARWSSDEPLEAFRPSGKPTLISFGDLSCFLVAGRVVLAGPSLAAAKEAVFELVMAQLDAERWWHRLARIADRGERAARGLLWPSVSSLAALRRQAHLSVLSG